MIDEEAYPCIRAIVDHVASVLGDISDDRRKLYGIVRSKDFRPSAWLLFRGLFVTGNIPRGIKIKGPQGVVRVRLAMEALLAKAVAHVVPRGWSQRNGYEVIIPYDFWNVPVYIRSQPFAGRPQIIMLEPVRNVDYFDFRGRSLAQIERDLQVVYNEILAFVADQEGFGTFDGAVVRACG